MSQVAEKICSTCGRTFRSDEDFLKDTYEWRVCAEKCLWFNCSCGSTLMMPEGSYPWYSPDMSLTGEAKSVFNAIAAQKSLPHIPTAVMALQTLLMSPGTETGDLVNAVRKDPLIAADLVTAYENQILAKDLRTSRPPSFAYMIAFVGRRHLSRLVSLAALKQFKLRTKIFKAEEHWKHAFQTGLISEHLWLRYCTKDKKDQVFLAGCLCNIGKIVSAILMPELIDKVAGMVKSNPELTWSEAEQQAGLQDHGIMGEIGCAYWGFPPFVLKAARQHHQPKSRAKTEMSRLVHTVSLANMLSHLVNESPGRINEDSFAREKQYFNLSDEDIRTLTEALGNHAVH